MVVLPRRGRHLRRKAHRSRRPGWRGERCDPAFARDRLRGLLLHGDRGAGSDPTRRGTRFTIGEPDGTISQRCPAFSEAMVAGLLKCPVEADLRKDIWLKLMGNIVFNPISVLTGATMGEIAGHRATRPTRSIDDGRDVGDRTPGSTPSPRSQSTAGSRARHASATTRHRCSWTTRPGKPLELDAVLNAPIELAALTGVDVPSLPCHRRVRRPSRRDPPALTPACTNSARSEGFEPPTF